MIEKIYITVFLCLYFLIIFLLPSIRVKRKTGINPYVFKNTDSAHDFLGKVSAPITSLVFIVAFINLILPKVYQYFAPFNWLEILILKYAGIIMIHIALLWIVTAQLQMNNSWRVGIDPSAITELKINGLFSVSRNPVFLGMIFTLCGIFLVLPNAITLLAAVVTSMLFGVQVRLEEDYLVKKHGEEYIKYCRKTRRWF